MLAADLDQNGYHLIPGFLTETECASLLSAIGAYRQNHDIPIVKRPSGDRPLVYSVIDGERIERELPQIAALGPRIGDLVNSLDRRKLALLNDKKVAINVNITAQGGGYRWHYDRNALTAILYLNSVEGGETECYPKYRIRLPVENSSAWQRTVDSLIRLRPFRAVFGRRLLVKAEAGKLLLMQGNTCLHSVLPVAGDNDRVNIIVSFDVPGKIFSIADGLNRYLYDGDTRASGDPNYS